MSLSRLSIRAMLMLACVALFAAAAPAQFRAGVQGTVTDSSGAVVKSAKITVTSQETGKLIEVQANGDGFYSVTNLGPGLYTISATLPGFKTKVVKDVQVAAEATSGVNLVLEPGAVTEQVIVSGDTLPALDTEDASLTGTITKQQIENLPQFRGDPFELLRLTPGVFGLGARADNGDSANFPNYDGVGGSARGIFQVENAVQVSANGSRVEANGYQIDGVSSDSQGYGGASVITPNTESVKEVKVEVTPYSAENSHGAGAIVEVVSQNGTNNIHGSAVLRTQSPGLNAFQRWGGPNGASPNRDNLLLHSYLGSVGGPILKNRLFVFFSFEHLKLAGNTFHSSSWQETSQWTGNLPSGSLGAKIFAVPGSGFLNPKILDSTCAILGLKEDTTSTGHVNGQPGTCQTVAGGVDLGSNVSGGGFIPNDAPCPPPPPGTPDPPCRYSYSTGGGLDGIPDVALVQYDSKGDNISTTQYNGRIDFNVTKNDLVAFSLFTVPLTKTFLPGGWVDGRQYNTFNTDGKNETAALLWTRTINSSTINEARMNVTRWYFDEIKSNPQAPFGVPNVNLTAGSFGGNGLKTVQAGFCCGPGVFFQTKYMFRDTLSKVHGSHVLKFGGEVGKEQNNSATTWAARPTYNFNNLWSFANDLPNDEGTTFFNPKTGVPTDFRKYFRSTTYGFFVQDNWKVKPNLTLTLGLRYDYFTPLGEKFGRLSNIALGQGAAALTGAKIKTGGDYTNPDRNNFGPQIGFAWSPRSLIGHEFNNKFVLRGGVGVAYNRVPGSRLWEAAGNPPDFIAVSIAGGCQFSDPNCAARSEIVYAFSSGGNNSFSGFPANPATIQTFDPNTGLPQPTSEHFAPPDINGAIRNLATPYTWHYSMEGQYDLGHNWVAALSYQGSQSRKYPRIFNDALIFARPTGVDTNDNTVNLINNVKVIQTDVNAHYNALLARITHRISRGLEMSANYRFSKSVDQCSSDRKCGQTYPFDQKTETGPSDFDVTHSFTANVLYELPFFKGRHDWLYTLAGGWKVDGILTLSSGFPWTPVTGGVCQRLSSGLDQVCPVRPAAFLGGAGSDFSTSTFQQAGGNFPAKTAGNAGTPGLDYFTPAVASTSGLPPVPGVARNSFRGPRYTGIDMSFGKRFTLPKMRVFGENAGFEIKANAFNIFNKLNLKPFGFNTDSTNINNSNFGRATGALGGRVIEFMGRFSF